MATTETTTNQSVSDKNTQLVNSIISPEELAEFKKIVFAEYGITLTDEQAFEQATALLLLFDSVIESTVDSRKYRVNMDSKQTGITSCKE